MGMDIAALGLLALTPLVLGGGTMFAKKNDQVARDGQRRTYRLMFPANVPPEQLTAFYGALSGSLRAKVPYWANATGLGNLYKGTHGKPTIVLETWGDSTRGIEWFMKIPFGYEPLREKLESLIPGIQVIHETNPPTCQWMYAEDGRLVNGHRPLHIDDPVLTNVDLRSSFSHVGSDGTLMLQIIVAPMKHGHKQVLGEAASLEQSLMSYLGGTGKANQHEVHDRNKKLDEKNFQVAVRVAATANTQIQAAHLVNKVTSSFNGTDGGEVHFAWRPASSRNFADRLNGADTPLAMQVQLTATELAVLSGWQIGDMTVAGQAAPVSRRFAAPNIITDQGRVVGQANYSGGERNIAQPYESTDMHTHIIGATGARKTTLMANMVKQDIDNGYGVVVIDSKDLVDMTLDVVPPHRAKDVILVDLRDT